jgi:hypothetical protein
MMNDMMPGMMLAMGLFWLLDHYCFDPGSRQALHQIPPPRKQGRSAMSNLRWIGETAELS